MEPISPFGTVPKGKWVPLRNDGDGRRRMRRAQAAAGSTPPASVGSAWSAPGAPEAPGDAAGAPGSGRIDHVCFNCDGIEEFIERLTRNGIEFSERKAHNSDLYQLFMREPINGIKVELNFSWQEAQRSGRVPGWTDAGAVASRS